MYNIKGGNRSNLCLVRQLGMSKQVNKAFGQRERMSRFLHLIDSEGSSISQG